MPQSKTQATAVVFVKLAVRLDQPWAGEATLEEVQVRAREQALQMVGQLAPKYDAANVASGAGRISIVEVTNVRVILNEEKFEG